MFQIRGNEFQITLPAKNLKIYPANAETNWEANSNYCYREEGQQSDGQSVYKLKLPAGSSIFSKGMFKHFIWCDGYYDEDDKIADLLYANGFIPCGSGDVVNQRRRMWFLIPASDFIGVKEDGYNSNNVLYPN